MEGNQKFIIIKSVNKKYDTEEALVNVLSYIIRDKDEVGEEVHYWNAFGVNNNSIKKAIMEFIVVQDLYQKAKRKRIRHIMISFPKHIDDRNIIKLVAEEVAEFIFEKYQVVYGIHEEKENLHIHFAFNPVSYNDGRKWHKSRKEFDEWKEEIGEIINCCLVDNGYKKCEIKTKTTKSMWI